MVLISGAICLFNDFDFLEDCINKIYNMVDEIIIVDGPYKYCLPILNILGLDCSENNNILINIKNKEKIKYYYDIYDNEKEKRIFLYNKCNYDIIWLIDSDEILKEFNKEEFDLFCKSDKSVSGFTFYNMIRTDAIINRPTFKNMFFKRNNINSIEHLNYIWLVGIKQEPMDQSKLYLPPIGSIYHLTLMRTRIFNAVKYCFYTRLSYIENNKLDQMGKLGNYEFQELIEKISPKQLLYIFSHSMYWTINCHLLENIIYYNFNDENLDKYKFNHEHGYINNPLLILHGCDVYFYCDIPNNLELNDKFILCLETNNINKGYIEFIQYKYNTIKYDTQFKEFIVDRDNNITYIEFYIKENKNDVFVNIFKINFTTDNNFNGLFNKCWIQNN